MPAFLSFYEQPVSKEGVAECKENLLKDRYIIKDPKQFKELGHHTLIVRVL